MLRRPRFIALATAIMALSAPSLYPADAEEIIPGLDTAENMGDIPLITRQAITRQPDNTRVETPGKDHDYRTIAFTDITGDTLALSDFYGKAVLIVNTASECGTTPQYAGLQELYEHFEDSGLVILGFPSNDFKQEPKSNEEIAEFCRSQYGVTFPMMAKLRVTGENKHPLFAYLTERSPHSGEITWNFNKFVLDREGKVVARYGSKVEPDDKTLLSDIRSVLY